MVKTRVAPRVRPPETLRPRSATASHEGAAPNPRLYYDLTAVGLCAMGLLVGLGLIRPGSTGALGRVLELAMRLLVGQVIYFLPGLLIVMGIALAADYRRTTRVTTLLGVGGLLIVLFGWLHLVAWPHGQAFASTVARLSALVGGHSADGMIRATDGGLAGALIVTILSPLDVAGSYVTLIAIGVSSLLLLTEMSIAAAARGVRDRSQRAAAVAVEPWRLSRERKGNASRPAFLDMGNAARPRPDRLQGAGEAPTGRGRRASAWPDDSAAQPGGDGSRAARNHADPAPLPATGTREEPRRSRAEDDLGPEFAYAASVENGAYEFPPLEILDTARSQPKKIAADTQANIAVLENTLAQFRIDAQVVEIADGPTVTRYEIRLGEGIRVKKILDLADNLAMSLAAMSVRVEAPIPGKSAIGIEVPKKQPAVVTLRECLETEQFANQPSLLTFALGKDVAGEPQYADLARMPHLLVAGATNSGKSVCLNVLIASLLYRARPEDLKMIMIDPKRVELTLFEGIPHLIHPVVKDVKQAAGILRWVLKEMEHRYDLFAQVMTRNIEGYNAKAGEHPDRRLPFIVVVIDELADLMMLQGPEVEQSICRLAQLARATGIHLVIATQRPSVDVITGLIKANIPSRIAFTVTSHIDSRTILDGKGAESLIGRGDMLFKPVDAVKPLRVQGAFVSEAEVTRIVQHLRAQGPPAFLAQPITVDSAAVGSRECEEDAEDDMFEPAARFIVTTGHASTSMIQRKFKIGYTRAARLVDMMEARGIVGSLDGARPREILVSPSRLDELFRNTRGALFAEGEEAELAGSGGQSPFIDE
jgi:S-DNA-T family DNA segregation ATPase FtsK/SpoIIIE